MIFSWIFFFESFFFHYSNRIKVCTLFIQDENTWRSARWVVRFMSDSFIHWSLVLWILFFCLSNSPKENLSCTSFACNLGWKNFKTPMDGFILFTYLVGFTFIHLLFDHCFMILLLKSIHSTMDKSSSSLGVNRGGTIGEPGFSRLDLLWEGIHRGWTSTHPCNTEKIPKSI
jgi:hypothetical protein